MELKGDSSGSFPDERLRQYDDPTGATLGVSPSQYLERIRTPQAQVSTRGGGIQSQTYLGHGVRPSTTPWPAHPQSQYPGFGVPVFGYPDLRPSDPMYSGPSAAGQAGSDRGWHNSTSFGSASLTMQVNDGGSDDEDLRSIPVGGQTKGASRRPLGTCSNCKWGKMRCTFEEGSDICQRCKTTGKSCYVEGRKPRAGPSSRELMLREMASKNQVIDSLLGLINDLGVANHRPAGLPATGRLPDREVLAWAESIRRSRSPRKGGMMDMTSATSSNISVVPQTTLGSTNERLNDSTVGFEKSVSSLTDEAGGNGA